MAGRNAAAMRSGEIFWVSHGRNSPAHRPYRMGGLCAGLFRPWLTQKISPLRIAAAFLPAIVLGSILYQSGSLALIYGGDSKLAFFVTKLATRSVQFAVTGVLDVLLVWALCRSRVFTAAGVWPTAAQPAQKGVSGQ